MDRVAEVLDRVRDDVGGGRSFPEAMDGLRAELDVTTVLPPADPQSAGRLAALAEEATAGIDGRWNSTAAVGVVVQTLLLGADSDDREYWSAQYGSLLAALPEGEWNRTVDAVTANGADDLLSPDDLRRVAADRGKGTSRSTLDRCCQRLATTALDRGEVDAAIWAVDRAATPFRLAAQFVESRSEVGREAVAELYRRIAGSHRTDETFPAAACGHWLVLGERGRARALLPIVEQAVAQRPASASARVAVLAAVLLGERARATRIAELHSRAVGLDDADALGYCLRPEGTPGPLEARLLGMCSNAQTLTP